MCKREKKTQWHHYLKKAFLKAGEKHEFIALKIRPLKRNESSELKFITDANFDGVSTGLKPGADYLVVIQKLK